MTKILAFEVVVLSHMCASRQDQRLDDISALADPHDLRLRFMRRKGKAAAKNLCGATHAVKKFLGNHYHMLKAPFEVKTTWQNFFHFV